MPTTELRPNIKPDYKTDPFSLVLTSSGEKARAVPALSNCNYPEISNIAPIATLIYHAFDAEDAIASIGWLRSCWKWRQIIVSFSGSSTDLEKVSTSCIIDQLIPVNNRGRNILPLLQICRERLEPDELVLHLHGKQSLAAWREQLEQQLIRDPKARKHHQYWLSNPENGVIAPTTFADVKIHATWEGNFAIARDLFARAYPKEKRLSPYNLLSFPAGGMFWFRARVLQRMANVIEAADFPPEPMPPDRSVAHAIERLIFHCCEAEGLRWAFAYQGGPALASLEEPLGVLSDWRDHYIELLLQRTHGNLLPLPLVSTHNAQEEKQNLKKTLKNWLSVRRNNW